jgi:hypothetical protein
LIEQKEQYRAWMKRGRRNFEIGAQRETLPEYKPSRWQKVVQRVGKDSLGVPKEDAKESLMFGRVVEAGGSSE